LPRRAAPRRARAPLGGQVLKPFPIACRWAIRVTDEFFLQVASPAPAARRWGCRGGNVCGDSTRVKLLVLICGPLGFLISRFVFASAG
jgi:hypothetical protein